MIKRYDQRVASIGRIRPTASPHILVTVLVGSVLAYIISGIGTVLAVQYPAAIRFNRWLLMGGAIVLAASFSQRSLRDIRRPRGLAAFAMLMTFALVHDLLFPSEASFAMSTQIGKFYLLYTIAINVYDTRYEYSLLIGLVFIFTAASLILFFLYYNSLSLGLVAAYGSGQRTHAETIGIDINANTLSYMAVLLYLISVRLSELVRSHAIVILNITALLAAGTVVLLNQSLVAFGLLALVLFISTLSQVSQPKQLAIKSVATVLTAFFVFSAAGQTGLGSGLLARAQEGGSLVTRQYLIKSAFGVFRHNPVFGASYDSIATQEGTTHAFYLVVAAVLGLGGLALFLWFLKALLVVDLATATLGQWMARLFIVVFLAAAPPIPLLAVTLLLMYPLERDMVGVRHRIKGLHV